MACHPLKRVVGPQVVRESELIIWAAITRRHMAIEAAARAYVETPTPKLRQRLRRALAREVRP